MSDEDIELLQRFVAAIADAVRAISRPMRRGGSWSRPTSVRRIAACLGHGAVCSWSSCRSVLLDPRPYDMSYGQ
jgi:hypothetical protein